MRERLVRLCVFECLTGAGPEVGHERVTFAAAAFVTALRVRAVSVAAAVHDGALVDICHDTKHAFLLSLTKGSI